MDENPFIVLIVEDSIDNVTYEKLQFQLASNVDVLCDVLVGLGEHMTDHQAICFLKLGEFLSFGIEMLRLKLLYLKFRNVIEEKARVLLHRMGQSFKLFLELRSVSLF